MSNNLMSDNYKGFTVVELINYLKTLPKKTRILINTIDGERPFNSIEEPYETLIPDTILFNSLYEDEFND